MVAEISISCPLFSSSKLHLKLVVLVHPFIHVDLSRGPF
jgi:hypothetical protein